MKEEEGRGGRGAERSRRRKAVCGCSHEAVTGSIKGQTLAISYPRFESQVPLYISYYLFCVIELRYPVSSDWLGNLHPVKDRRS